MLEQGPTEQRIIEQCIRERRPLPTAIKNAPELQPGLGLYYTAYLDLQGDRQVGMSEGLIPWTAVDRYAERNQFDDETREDLQYHVRKLDEAYLAHKAEKRLQASKQRATRKGLPRRPGGRDGDGNA